MSKDEELRKTPLRVPPVWSFDEAVDALGQHGTLLQPPTYDPEARRNAYEDQIVGPHGETRAQMRVKMLGQLDDLEEFVTARWQEGTLVAEDVTHAMLSLRIHRERCGLLGIPAGVGEPW